MSTASRLPSTGPSLFDDLVAGLAALDERAEPAAPATLHVTVDVAGRRSELELPADGGPLVIGRAADADIVVVAPQASRSHAELRSADGRVWCHDAGSSYGTWVERDGARLSVPSSSPPETASSRPATSSCLESCS